MDIRDQSNHHLLHASAAPHHLNLHQQQPLLSQTYPSSSYSSYSYFPNPNPNPISKLDNPLPSSAAADVGILRPPGVDPYLPDPYAPYVGYDGTHPAPHLYTQTTAAAAAAYYHGGGGEAIQQQYGLDPFSYGVMKKVGTGKTIVDLETKKRKVIEGGAPADSVRVCSVCNVVCNSDKVFASHLAGEKHAFKALGIPSNGMKPKAPAHVKAMYLTNKAIPRTPRSTTKKGAKGTIAFVQSSYCEVCKIDCNSQEVLNKHKLGKKHIKNLQKLQGSIPSKPASAPVKNVGQKDTSIGSKGKAVSEQSQQNAAPATKKDLESKKLKVLNGGAAADAVRVCTLCNIVCNSQTVFNFHIAGQKHIAMVNKQQATPVS